MSGMPFGQALLLVAAVIIIALATEPRRLHPFLALIIVATAFGFAAGMSVGFVGKAFGAGFAQAIYSPGLVIVAAALVAGLADGTGAAEQLKAAIARWPWLGSTRLAAAVGLMAGIGAVPASALALIRPLLPAIAGDKADGRRSAPIAAALALSASHGLVVAAPVPIAAAAILGASWPRVALFGVPLVIVLAAFGAVLARWLPAGDALPPPPTNAPLAAEENRGGAAAGLVLAAAVPLLLLMVQSIGDIPSEPLGGGADREFVIGLGRPLMLFLVAVGIMAIGQWRQSVKLLADPAWSTRILGNVAGVVLTVGAAGGLARICQETGMAALVGERLLAWHLGGPTALVIPFLAAAAIKTLQGSSLVAAITAAGMVQPLLAPLGLGGGDLTALAALAVGAGAMTVSHVNDDYFWLVADSAGLAPSRALATLTLGTLLQGLAAIAALLIVAALLPA